MGVPDLGPAVPANWSQYSMAQMWTMVEPENEADHSAHVQSWLRAQQMFDQHAENLTKIRQEVAEAWPPEGSQASQEFLRRMDHWILSVKETAGACYGNAQGLSDIADVMMGARKRMKTLVDRWSATTDGLEAQALTLKARDVMAGADQGLYDNAQRFSMPGRYDVDPAGEGLPGRYGPSAGGHRPAWSGPWPPDSGGAGMGSDGGGSWSGVDDLNSPAGSGPVLSGGQPGAGGGSASGSGVQPGAGGGWGRGGAGGGWEGSGGALPGGAAAAVGGVIGWAGASGAGRGGPGGVGGLGGADADGHPGHAGRGGYDPATGRGAVGRGGPGAGTGGGSGAGGPGDTGQPPMIGGMGGGRRREDDERFRSKVRVQWEVRKGIPPVLEPEPEPGPEAFDPGPGVIGIDVWPDQ